MRTLRKLAVGVDEVGRGSWAGPLVAGAVLLCQPIVGLKDSKQLSRARREALAEIIAHDALYSGLGWVQPQEVDELGLTRGLRLAFERALEGLHGDFDELIIDGSINFFSEEPRARAIVKADQSVPSVSAASIVAKVARDRYMQQAAQQYPGYGFESHVGYGTARHKAALQQLGICELHRRSFRPIRQYLGA